MEPIVLHPFEDATLTPLNPLPGAHRRAVIVCPGGAYNGHAPHEGKPVADCFAAGGLAAFLLYYSVKEKAADFAPLCEAALAIRHIRQNAESLGVDPAHIFICGFSAGGHLAASAGTLYGVSAVRALLGGEDPALCRPDGMILCYPVITSEPNAIHTGTFRRACGKQDPTKAEMDAFSLEKHVTAHTPPAFLWHTLGDTAVPMENSILMANALRRAGVPFELHIFPEGEHGQGLCDGSYAGNYPHNAHWIDLAIEWARDVVI